jgi:diazepam-binding inhibitor (GABA receptor modulating acyl-CoA-binding protein)
MTLEEQFEAAKVKVQTLDERPSNEVMLNLYALNKQATVGDINIEKPAMFDFVAMAKYNAWTAKSGVSKEGSMQQYIDLVESLFK